MNQTTLPQLIKGSATYKLVVPEKVEEKIRYLLRKFPQTEWSGVLFTTHQGSFEDGDLVVTCEDIYPMDLGNAVYTQFNMSEDVAAYMAENVELFDCDLQLVHSHHYMATTPSGTDLNTLREEGAERNCFVSLIVNNAGTYYAAITRKIQTKSEVTIRNLGKSYEFFGEGSKEITHDGTETTKVIEKEVIEYFDLEVERHEVQNSLDYLDVRFDEIARKKNAVQENDKASLQGQTKVNDDTSFLDFLHNARKEPTEQDLFGKPVITNEDKKKLDDIVPSWEPDAQKIRRAAMHIITCNLIINPEKVNLKQWVKIHMVKVYERIFGKHTEQYMNHHNSCAFTEWMDFIVQFTIDYFDDDAAPEELYDNMDIYMSRVAEALYDEISQFKGENFYIDAYLEVIEQYIMF